MHYVQVQENEENEANSKLIYYEIESKEMYHCKLLSHVMVHFLKAEVSCLILSSCQHPQSARINVL